MSDNFLIVNRGLYYRPAAEGYTGVKTEAGRFTRAEAERRTKPDGQLQQGMFYIHEDTAGRFSSACPDEIRNAHLAEQRYKHERTKLAARGVPDWEAFGRDVMGVWPTGDLDGGHLQDLAEKHRIITPVLGGFDPKRHHDFEHVAEPGDPWFTRNY